MFAGSALVVSAVLYAVGVTRLWRHAGVGQGIRRWQAIAFASGWLTLVIALIALDELSDRLFAAHMAQHELLIVVAAPLLAASGYWIALLWALRIRMRTWPKMTLITAPAVVWLLHAAALWVWHIPSLYDLAVEHEPVHVLQHASFLGSAVLFWWGLLHGRYGRAGYGAAVIYIFATAIHSGILGALLTFSSTLWYPHYAHAGLEDQQLAGLLMWIPASVIFIAGGLYFFAAWLRESERRAQIFAAR
ncbi:MAG TPA: cytochrome c oxidase assembly protein [Vicinamibacterales bacterium]|nr:cytochrome c oxidase assembly protein [Vicinamibacterales bacterium]